LWSIWNPAARDLRYQQQNNFQYFLHPLSIVRILRHFSMPRRGGSYEANLSHSGQFPDIWFVLLFLRPGVYVHGELPGRKEPRYLVTGRGSVILQETTCDNPSPHLRPYDRLQLHVVPAVWAGRLYLGWGFLDGVEHSLRVHESDPMPPQHAVQQCVCRKWTRHAVHILRVSDPSVSLHVHLVWSISGIVNVASDRLPALVLSRRSRRSHPASAILVHKNGQRIYKDNWKSIGAQETKLKS